MKSDQTDTIIIKKYPSRRLYDTHNKCFITIRRLGKIIREGQNVSIVDKETGDDITKTILTQVIVEEEKANRDILPADLLHQLIRGSSSMYKEALDDFVTKGAKTIQKAKHDVESSLLSLVRPKPSKSGSDELDQIKARLAELEALLKKKSS